MSLFKRQTAGPSDEKPTELPVEEQLFAAMDVAALRFIKILENPTDKDGKPIYSLDEQTKVFNLGRDWLIRRAKLKPKKEDDGSPGVEEIKRLIAEAAAEGGYTRPARGRPPKAVTAARKANRTPQERRDDEADDSGLQALLKGKQP